MKICEKCNHPVFKGPKTNRFFTTFRLYIRNQKFSVAELGNGRKWVIPLD